MDFFFLIGKKYILISFVKKFWENEACEDGCIPGLGQVPGTGCQVRFFGFAQKRI